MRLNQIRVFLAVVESGSIRAAARSLEVSPPAVSKSLRQLEEELRVRLLERTQHGVVTTPAGRAFVARARVIRSELRKAEEEFAQFSGDGAGSVAIGVGPTEMILIVPDALAEFRQQLPRARVRIVEGRRPAWLPLVRDETLDFAVGLRPEGKLDSGLAFRPLFRSDFVVAARKGHPLRNARSLAQLAGAEWLTLAPRSQSAGLLEQAFSLAGLPAPPPPMIECESFNGIVAVVARTDMLTLVAHRLLAMPFARDLLQEIPVAEKFPPVTHGIFTNAHAPLTRTAAAMLKAVSAVARKHARGE
ncbi:MAG: LysR substrate-binding domain-containing protein [Burkholderiales bacterium]